MGARLKYCARPAPSHTTLTTLGLSSSATLASGCAAVPMLAWGHWASTAATASIKAGAISGSSPCTLTTISSSAKPSCSQASARRSLPLGWSLRVSSAATPCAAQACTMRASSAATTVRCAPLRWACWATRTTMGTPAKSAKGLSGRRLEAMRAGISTVKAAAVLTALPARRRSGCGLLLRA